jgi:hypothetical protein
MVRKKKLKHGGKSGERPRRPSWGNQMKWN